VTAKTTRRRRSNPPPISDPHPLGPTARALALRPPLAYGGHCFLHLDDTRLLMRCVGCHWCGPRWVVTEGFWPVELTRWCPSLFRALPAGQR
jgi:hypothetical protein